MRNEIVFERAAATPDFLAAPSATFHPGAALKRVNRRRANKVGATAKFSTFAAPKLCGGSMQDL